ncbi:hypothetical protein UFOVP191_63 [uncultured Caudovirales phage]|uniref:Uncharacterized protein n=1 Tax=uncultured Caudovirales phage TaxID=2100421 RepID=A0A6J7WGK4_9CAUD|nr:hypothetical protein UFOVP191_63 [uncultured Caudovirales phage]
MPVTPDTSVFSKLQGFADYQRANDDFMLKKALTIQAAQKNALETQALQATAANGGLTLKDMLTMREQQQTHADNLDMKKQQLESTNAYRDAMLGDKQNKEQEKKDLKFRTDQNLLANATNSIDKQIAHVDALFDGDNLKPDVANVYGTTLGYQTPIFYQGTRDAKTKLDFVNAGAFINSLADMKNQSATGASGLGALSEREGDKVQSAAMSAADTKQSPESAAAALKLYKQTLLESKGGLQSGFKNIYSDRFPTASTLDPELAKAELKKRGLIQ